MTEHTDKGRTIKADDDKDPSPTSHAERKGHDDKGHARLSVEPPDHDLRDRDVLDPKEVRERERKRDEWRTTGGGATLMRVRATHFGYADAKRHAGDVFEVPRWMFSERWMEPVEAHTPVQTLNTRDQTQPIEPRRPGSPKEGEETATGKRDVI